jgi:hypothetical protein
MVIFFMFMFMSTFAKIEGTDPKDVYHPARER